MDTESPTVSPRKASGLSVRRVGKYNIGKTLGEGAYGKVKYATNRDSGEGVAVKILDQRILLKRGLTEHAKREIAILRAMNHPNVIGAKDVLLSKTRIYIIMELVTGGELFYKLASARRFDEDTARRYFHQLIAGVSYCHLRGVCHRDLKPENLLLTDKDVLKISDFGLSTFHRADDGTEKMLSTPCGTANYMAPEVITRSGYEGPSADVWSCGIILYVLLAGRLPFDEDTPRRLYEKIIKAEYKCPPWFSSDIKRYLRRFIEPNPAHRITLKEAQMDPWFQMNLNSDSESEEEDIVPFEKMKLKSLQNIKEDLIPKESPLLKKINVFDLIAMSGALNLTPLLKSSGTGKQRTGAGRAPNPRGLRTGAHTHFVLEGTPDDIKKVITTVLGTFEGLKIKKAKEESYKWRTVSRSTLGTLITMIRLYMLSPELYLVDCRRVRGDALAYHKFYKKFSSLIRSHKRDNDESNLIKTSE